ncbi:hypothetical protein ABZ799_01495 [Nocardiopsis dassonvillei]|uniref:hypothetical protein n=1 Tax=Nocardiopsis dassonvillei TaxID=2014 RepID=UPI0034078218
MFHMSDSDNYELSVTDHSIVTSRPDGPGPAMFTVLAAPKGEKAIELARQILRAGEVDAEIVTRLTA